MSTRVGLNSPQANFAFYHVAHSDQNVPGANPPAAGAAGADVAKPKLGDPLEVSVLQHYVLSFIQGFLPRGVMMPSFASTP
jgi:hypothetical protein